MITDYYIDCTRRRPIETKNTSGRQIKTYTDTAIKGYRGNSTSKTQNIINIAGKETVEIGYNFYSNDFDLMFGDVIVYEDVNYIVASNPRNTAHKDHHTAALIKVIDNVT